MGVGVVALLVAFAVLGCASVPPPPLPSDDLREAIGNLGVDFGAGLRAREIDYLIAHEWARTADDVLWRRTKCGLHLDEHDRAAVAAYVAGHGGSG